ncbi:hypothetical protein NL676_002577 [Syzygium grande]|nr:hypothetical protein NL676_002577 [Syzygium grande]
MMVYSRDRANSNRFTLGARQGRSRPSPMSRSGGGLRMCIGNELARVETLTVVHNLVTGYEWFQLDLEEAITRQPLPCPSMGLPIKITPR